MTHPLSAVVASVPARRLVTRLAALSAAGALLVSCAASPPVAPPAVALAPAPVADTSAATLAAHVQSTASTLDAYKRDVARHIYRSNPEARFDGAPPPLLRSVVVLSIRVDAAGNPLQVSIVRSNGFTDLEQVAVRSVRAAAPLPMPSRAVARAGSTEYYETWLFRDDGRFQIRSLAEVQAVADDQ